MHKADILSLRSFKNPFPARDLDKSFYQWRQAFKTLHVDLGCGVGYHPLQLSKAHPTSGILAIERTKVKFLSMQRRISNHQANNLYSLHDDAENWLIQNLTEQSVDHFYFLYPNPYPKEKQANKRWHRNPFFEVIKNRLKNKGQITFATNEEWLANEYEDYMLNYWKLSLSKKEILFPSTDRPFRTHFEKKYLLRGEHCFNLVFTKE